MFDNLKSKETESDLVALNKEVKELKSSLAELKDLHVKELSAIKKEHQEYTKHLKSNIDLFDKAPALMEFLAQTASRFEALNKGLHSQLMQRFDKQITEELVQLSSSLKLEKSTYDKIRKDIEELAKTALTVKDEIKRLSDLTAAIKKEDFELTKHHQMMIKEDQNKVELLKRIDQLERMLASMKQPYNNRRFVPQHDPHRPNHPTRPSNQATRPPQKSISQAPATGNPKSQESPKPQGSPNSPEAQNSQESPKPQGSPNSPEAQNSQEVSKPQETPNLEPAKPSEKSPEEIAKSWN